MSHSTGAVKFPDGTILYTEYNGTSDVMLPNLYLTPEERNDNWRKQEWRHHSINCEHPEQVIIATSYGGGFSWNGWACKSCKLVYEPLMPFEEGMDGESIRRTDGLPDWYPNRELY